MIASPLFPNLAVAVAAIFAAPAAAQANGAANTAATGFVNQGGSGTDPTNRRT